MAAIFIHLFNFVSLVFAESLSNSVATTGAVAEITAVVAGSIFSKP